MKERLRTYSTLSLSLFMGNPLFQGETSKKIPPFFFTLSFLQTFMRILRHIKREVQVQFVPWL